MLNVCIFFCPCHKDKIQLFDTKNHRPYTGECNHIVCEECVKKQEEGSCPFCHQEGAFVGKSPNYAALNAIKDRRLNFWENLKDWWAGETFDHGSCSSCDVSPTAYRICLTCAGDRLCERVPEIRLKIKSNGDLLNFFGNVICIDCVDENHGEHETIMVRKIKYAERDIKLAAANIILELFRRELKDKKGSIDCELRQMQLKNVFGLSTLVNDLNRTDEGQCGYFDEVVKMELINRYIINMDKKIEAFFCEYPKEEPICECTKLYDKVKQTGLYTDIQHTYELMSWEDVERFTPGCPIFFRTHLEKRKELCATVGEAPSNKVTPEPFNDKQCPFCVMIDHRNHTDRPKEFYVKNWMTTIHEFWNSDKTRFEHFCLRCLHHLKRYHVGISCERFYLHYKKTSAKCTQENCIMKDPYHWKYVMNREVVSEISKIMKDGIEGTYFQCQLRKIRMEKLKDELFSAICRLSKRHDTPKEFTEKVEKVDIILESIKAQWNKLKSDNEVEWMGYEVANNTKCKCTQIWEKNQEMLKEFKYFDEEKKKYEDLENCMTSMAVFGLLIEIPGCPMDFDHKIILNEETIRELNVEHEDSTKSVPLFSDKTVINLLFEKLNKVQEEVSEMSRQMRFGREGPMDARFPKLVRTVSNLGATGQSTSISINELNKKVANLEVLVMSSEKRESTESVPSVLNETVINSLLEKLNKVQEENKEMNRQLRFVTISNLIILVGSLCLIRYRFL